ncbi:unnamed protein product [Prorocentrum cordatum]|uniref:Uncharacterized protein n=1 Tax=Prorocentrum cordatum TaxID=2364126 RepID=A0ABN9QW28_9DINO|nr:unnamed protein product [Polarella glacialis]|mmetsp:Transcript_127205/g.341352  ORF Transcript_127205/g.341352 Transcript_127205/m.341352 type:complete len:285 (+) Transcript_127205:53-907(+)
MAAQLKEDGNAKLKAGDKDGALAMYTQGITEAQREITDFPGGNIDDIKPLQTLLTQLFSNRAHVLIQMGRPQDAIEDCHQAVAVDSQNSKAYWRGASAALKIDEHEVAAEFVRKGLTAVDVNDSKALVELFGKSFSAWEVGAAEGGVASQYMLGLAYLKGNGVKRDISTGVSHMKIAADRGDEMAVQMIERVESEQAAAKSSAEASAEASAHFSNDNPLVDFWIGAAQEGDPAAQFNLGLAFLKGEGVPQDSAKCIELWTKAAQNGDEMAQQNLLALHREQRGS